LTPLGKLILFVLGLAIVFFSVKNFAPELYSKLVPGPKVRESQTVKPIVLPELPDAPSGSPSSVTTASAPSADAGCADKPEVRMLIWAWNAHAGAMLANGGAQATKGSLMCERGVNLRFVRQDDVSQMQNELIAFATDLKSGNANPAHGAHFVTIMGDGSATFLKAVNDTLGRLGADYKAKVVGSCGYSRGEDKFMGPPEWKSNPASSKGGLVAGVLRDGDWNIAQKWLGDNGLCNNPDEKTYDPACLNWVNSPTYIEASNQYVAGYCETRPVVSGGRRTGQTKKVCVNGVVTWTPGDVIVAEKKGGLVSIVSTKEYSSQMPNVIIGIDKWMRDNRKIVEGMLDGIFTGGDRIKSDPSALRRASEISAAVYKEDGADASYWEKYFRVVVEKDKQGLSVELGGSSVNNLADNRLLFGMDRGSSNLFGATYRVFGDLVVSQYPDLVPSYFPVADILDTSYVEGVGKKGTAAKTEADKPTFTASSQIKTVVSRKSWHINFDSGKATFTGDAQRDLDQLLRDLLVANAAAVEVHGHTDSQGDPKTNMQLSEDRAFAVKSWLEKQSPVNFPQGRLRVFSHGQENPVAPNSTPEGRAQNRRVDIVIGTTS
jgi:outer membrane protein OmpA-like peptidoglycan-associated protein